MNADISSEYVQEKLLCVWIYGGLLPIFAGSCKTSIVANLKEKFTGDCKHRPQDFQLDNMHHGFEIHYQAILAAGASKKTEIEVRY